MIGAINGLLSVGHRVYLASEPKMSLMLCDNDVFCVHSFWPMISEARLVVRGECKGLRNIETGRVYDSPVLLPPPCHRGDAARTREALPEFAFDIAMMPGKSVYLEILDQ